MCGVKFCGLAFIVDLFLQNFHFIKVIIEKKCTMYCMIVISVKKMVCTPFNIISGSNIASIIFAV